MTTHITPTVCVQTQGLGTALKILFSEREIQNLPEHPPSKGFQLTRQEIVALLNAFSRYAGCWLSCQPSLFTCPCLFITSCQQHVNKSELQVSSH